MRPAAPAISAVVRGAYAACLLAATFNHARIVARHGLLWDYGGVPVASAAFWTSLTVLDPMAIILLFVRPNAGVAVPGTIIVVDAVHNLWMTARSVPRHQVLGAALANPFVASQVAFMLFVAITAPVARVRRAR